MKVLTLAALDYVSKPDTNREITTSLDFRREGIRKIKMPGRAPLRRPGTIEPAADEAYKLSLSFTRRPFALVPPRVVTIGSSTGGT